MEVKKRLGQLNRAAQKQQWQTTNYCSAPLDSREKSLRKNGMSFLVSKYQGSTSSSKETWCGGTLGCTNEKKTEENQNFHDYRKEWISRKNEWQKEQKRKKSFFSPFLVLKGNLLVILETAELHVIGM